jgi:beta-glucosidase
MEDVKKILSKLTLEEKCLLLTGKDFWETQPLKKLDFPSINVSDGPFGVRKVVKSEKILDNSLPATCFPTSTALSSTWNVNLVRKVGSAIAIECIDQDVDVILGPGLNIKRSPLCGRNFEYFSEDPYLSGTMAAAFVKGVQQNGVGACLKHFVANNQEELRLTMNSIVDERAMREIYAKGFEIAIKDSNPMMVMCSYNQVNGKHVSRNSKILNDLIGVP